MLNVQTGNIYRNIKTGNKYRIVFIARASWDVEQELVVYEWDGPETFSVWVRSLNEFREKFEEVTE